MCLLTRTLTLDYKYMPVISTYTEHISINGH